MYCMFITDRFRRNWRGILRLHAGQRFRQFPWQDQVVRVGENFGVACERALEIAAAEKRIALHVFLC